MYIFAAFLLIVEGIECGYVCLVDLVAIRRFESLMPKFPFSFFHFILNFPHHIFHQRTTELSQFQCYSLNPCACLWFLSPTFPCPAIFLFLCVLSVYSNVSYIQNMMTTKNFLFHFVDSVSISTFYLGCTFCRRNALNLLCCLCMIRCRRWLWPCYWTTGSWYLWLLP